MRKLIILCVLLSIGPALIALQPLEKIYGSGLYQGGNISLLTWSDSVDHLLYHAGSQIYSVAMDNSDFGDGWNSANLVLPDHPYAGFKSDPQSRLNPIYWDAATDPPSSLYALAENDPAGDNQFTDNLDILSYKASFTSGKFHFQLSNGTGEYPVNTDMEFFTYMIVLVDPFADPNSDPIVYGLMYTVDMGTLISPGLYKITGTEITDLIRIADITHSVDTQAGLLYLSCDIDALTADPDFSSWFDPDYPLIDALAMTSRITLTAGNQEADMTNGCQILFKAQSIPVDNQHAPLLSNPQVQDVFVGDQHHLIFSIDYADADANFPRLCSFTLDSNEALPMHPLSPPQELDFAQTVTFTTDLIPCPASDWNEGVFSFSHGDIFINETIINQTPVNEELTEDIFISMYPNPVHDEIYLEANHRTGEDLDLAIYNARGQKTDFRLVTENDVSRIRLDVSSLPAGVYFLQMHNSLGSSIKRFVKLD
jgi:hypothetical protein